MTETNELSNSCVMHLVGCWFTGSCLCSDITYVFHLNRIAFTIDNTHLEKGWFKKKKKKLVAHWMKRLSIVVGGNSKNEAVWSQPVSQVSEDVG